MTTDYIQTRIEGGVLEICIDRPKAKNSLLVAMYQAMTDALEGAAPDPAVKVVLFRGEGGAFTSGNDLRDFLDHPPTGPESTVFRFMQTLAAFPKPIVAQVEGVAVGIGSTMLLHCDLVYAAADTRFIMPFVPLALVPEAAASYVLPRVAGHRLASELLLFGESFDAETARQLGLVSRILPPEELAAFVRQRIEKLVALPPSAVLETKKILKRHQDEEIARTIDHEAVVFCRLLGSPENQEAIHAFFEKRKPDFDKLA